MKKTFISAHYRRQHVSKRSSEDPQHTSSIKIDSKYTGQEAIILIGSFEDFSLFNPLISNAKQGVALLFIEEIGMKWNFSFDGTELRFKFDGKIIRPLGIYYRGYHSEINVMNTDLFLALDEAIELWEGNKLGALKKHYHNASKPFQLTSTINKTLRDVPHAQLSSPNSYFFKGEPHQILQFLKDKDLVVKSCSCISSEVVDRVTFLSWDLSSLRHLPTFFQTCIRGPNIRVHLLQEHLWAMIIMPENEIDYRFVPEFLQTTYRPTVLSVFVQNVLMRMQKAEELALCGIDLIQKDDQLFCLECNSNPGWANFHQPSEEKIIVQEILKMLGGADAYSSLRP